MYIDITSTHFYIVMREKKKMVFQSHVTQYVNMEVCKTEIFLLMA